MPFKSDKQRRYLWSQKPEVAKQIAYKNTGGPLSGRHGDPSKGTGIYNWSYEDPILLNELKRKMQDRKAMFEDAGYGVEHNYMDQAEFDRNYGKSDNPHNYSPGGWHAHMKDKYRSDSNPSGLYVDIPMTPSLTNALVGEEEYSHLLGAWDRNRPEQGPGIIYGDGRQEGVDDRLYEEMRAKQEAVRNVGGRLSPDVADAFDNTLDSYMRSNDRLRDQVGYDRLPTWEKDMMFDRAGEQAGRSGHWDAEDVGFYRRAKDRSDRGQHFWQPGPLSPNIDKNRNFRQRSPRQNVEGGVLDPRGGPLGKFDERAAEKKRRERQRQVDKGREMLERVRSEKPTRGWFENSDTWNKKLKKWQDRVDELTKKYG